MGSPQTARLREELRSLAGFQLRDDAGVTVKPISVTGTRRIVRFALDYADRHARKRITIGHKANIMKFSDGVFLLTAVAEAAEHPNVELEPMQMDELAMWLAWEPETMDVLLLPNLYGDIVSDLCAGLVGGLGLAPGANLGWEYAVFEPVHGSAPDIAGRGLANPTAIVASAALLLRHLNEPDAAGAVEGAVRRVLEDGEHVTRDLGGNASTEEMARALAAAVRGSR
jgi:isocitrate dehydrogenase (NAD+)